MIRVGKVVAVLAALLLVLLWPVLSMYWAQWVARHHGVGANLTGANLLIAPLTGADLRGANLQGACLMKARCCDADFRGADLREADMRSAILGGADLRGARLAGATLIGTIYDRYTLWPAGFDPKVHGASLPEWDEKRWRSLGRRPRSVGSSSGR